MKLKDAIRNFCLNETQAKEYFHLDKSHRFANVDEYYNHQVELIMKYFKARGLPEDVVIPKAIIDLMKTLKEGQPLNTQVVTAFINHLKNETNDYLHDGLLGLVNKIILAIYDSYKKIFKDLQESIVQQVASGQELSPDKQDRFLEYTPLVNSYLLVFKINLKMRKNYSFGFPETRLEFLHEKDDIPLFLNSLILGKKIRTQVEYFGISFLRPLGLSKPFLRQKSFSVKRGIKDISQYTIFQRWQKLQKGATRNELFLASNGIKIIFLRDSSRPHQNEIFSSKLAAFVSKKHFSSERLFSNGLTGSRKLTAYKTSAIDDRVFLKIKELANASTPKFFPGTGLIDEVLNFLDEKDPNMENYGVSSLEIDGCFFSKVDFDFCDVINPSEKYEKNRCTSGIYSSTEKADIARKEPQYLSEKFYARLKLCILTPEFYLALNGKVNFNQEEIKRVIAELTRRQETALNLMFIHPQFNEFLIQHDDILNTIHLETTDYVQSHFNADASLVVAESVTRKMQKIQQLIQDKISLKQTDKEVITLKCG